MTPADRDRLDQTFMELSRRYPDLRLGQLFEMLATFAGDATPVSPAEVDNDRLLGVAASHLERRGWSPAREAITESVPGLHDRRFLVVELLQLVRELQDRDPGHPLGWFVTGLASRAGARLYDVEDEDLLASGRRQLARLSA